MRSKWFVVPAVVFAIAHCDASFADEWRLVMGGSCVSGREMSGSDSQLTPQNFYPR
jgi:hypothetical protein